MLGRGIALVAALVVFAVPVTAVSAAPKPAETRDVLYVGNNWDGTADVVDPHTFQVLARINIIPDIAERMAEIQSNPERLAYYLAIRQLVGEGHDQYVDDMFSSHDGRFLYVSRPSSTPRRASASSRWSTRRASRCSRSSTWARSCARPATRT